MDSSQTETSKIGVPQALRKKETQPSNIFVKKGTSRLDSPEMHDILRKLQMWRRQARVAQADNRMDMAIDEDFYDGIQYEPEDLHVLKQRNQPPLVFNITKNIVNFILGTERMARIDGAVRPRKKRGASSAKAKTKMMKYTQDVSKGEFEWSQAFTESIKAGLGWIETGCRNNRDEIIFMRQERWRNMWFDHLGLSLDGSDWRFVFREKWCDLDIATKLFPERADELKVLSEGTNSLYPYLPDDIVVTDTASEFDVENDLDSLFGGPFDSRRERVKLVECWYRTPAIVQILDMVDDQVPLGTLDGAIYRKGTPDHDYLVNGGYFTISDALIMTVRCAIWAGSTMLQENLSPYNHNRFPFTPIFCYRRQRDNMPYGIIRDMRDPQSDLNKRKSRALFLLTANRIIYDKGAIDDPVKAYEEVNRPDGMVEINEGKRFEIQKELSVINAHVEMARDDERFISNITGVTPEARGQSERDLSGVAIGKLQRQSNTVSGVFFDNYYYSRQNEGEIRLSLVEQFKDKEEEYRITGSQSKDEFIRVNEIKGGRIVNSITEAKADFVIGKQDYRETVRMSMFQTLSDLVTSLSQSMPQVALAILDLVVDYMDDLPSKDELVARIRKINGQMGPDEEMTPEERQQAQQQKQASEQEHQSVKKMEQALAQLKIANEQAKLNAINSKALKDKVDSQTKTLESFLKAIEVSGIVRLTPELIDGADQLIRESRETITGEPEQG